MAVAASLEHPSHGKSGRKAKSSGIRVPQGAEVQKVVQSIESASMGSFKQTHSSLLDGTLLRLATVAPSPSVRWQPSSCTAPEAPPTKRTVRARKAKRIPRLLGFSVWHFRSCALVLPCSPPLFVPKGQGLFRSSRAEEPRPRLQSSSKAQAPSTKRGSRGVARAKAARTVAPSKRHWRSRKLCSSEPVSWRTST